MNTSTERQQGIFFAISGVFVLSFDALLVRLSAAAGADIAFWRGALVLLSAGGICYLRRHHINWPATPRLWLMAVLSSILYGFNSSLFVFSINNTHVANTVVILASSPLFAAAINWICFRESTPQRTLIAIFVAILGVLVVFSSSLGQPASSATCWLWCWRSAWP